MLGCGSVMRYAFDDAPHLCPSAPYVYGGVHVDLALINSRDAISGVEGQLITASFGILDLPFSAVVDTLLLPISIPKQSAQEVRCHSKK